MVARGVDSAQMPGAKMKVSEVLWDVTGCDPQFHVTDGDNLHGRQRSRDRGATLANMDEAQQPWERDSLRNCEAKGTLTVEVC